METMHQIQIDVGNKNTFHFDGGDWTVTAEPTTEKFESNGQYHLTKLTIEGKKPTSGTYDIYASYSGLPISFMKSYNCTVVESVVHKDVEVVKGVAHKDDILLNARWNKDGPIFLSLRKT